MIRIGVNTEELQERISKSGYKANYLAEMLEIKRTTYYRKLRGQNDFYPGEILKLCKLLKINKTDRKKIFRI